MGEFCQAVKFHCEWPANEGVTISSYTAKPAERQKKANNIRRWSSKAVRAQTVQIPMGMSASSTDLQQSGSTGQCSLTALGLMLVSLASVNKTIPLVYTKVLVITPYKDKSDVYLTIQTMNSKSCVTSSVYSNKRKVVV